MPLAVGVVDFRDDRRRGAVGVVAPEHGERVEDVAEYGGVAEHEHPAAAQADALACQAGVHVGADRGSRVAEVVAGPEPGEGAQRKRHPRHVVEVNEPQVAAVAERAPDRVCPDMGDLARIQRRRHQSTPRARAASMPDRQPSSWNPQPW